MSEEWDKQLEKALKDYTKDIQDGLEKEAKKAADEAAKKLKTASPKRTGKYGRNWAVTEKKSIGEAYYIVHNKKRYQLTHLLEYGHENRTHTGRVKAYPHIESIEKEANEQFEDGLKRVITQK